MDGEQELMAGFLGEIDHHVAQENDVERFAHGGGQAEVALLKAAQALEVGDHFPFVAGAQEILKEHAGRQTAIDLDALIAAGGGALDHFGREVGAEDLDAPAGEKREMLAEQDGQGIRLLAAGAGGGPETKEAGIAAAFDERGEEMVAEKVERGGVTKKAGLVDGHGLGNGALEGGRRLGAQSGNELIEGLEAASAEESLQAGLEEIVARGDRPGCRSCA